MKSKMTLSKKLTICVGSLMALMLVLGFTSLNSISQIHQELERTAQGTAMRVQLSGRMNTSAAEMLSAMRGIVLFSYGNNQAMVQMCQQQFEGAADNWQKTIDQFRPLIVTETGRKLVDEMQAGLTSWHAVFQEITASSNGGSTDERVNNALSQGLQLYQTTSGAARRLSELQNTILEKQRAASTSLANRSTWTAVAVLGVFLVVAVIVLMVVRATSRRLGEVAGELGRCSVQLVSAASQIASSSQGVAQGASEQAATIEETSASTEEITAMTRKSADGSREAAELMEETSQVVVEANRTLEKMEASMREISTSSSSIGKIIKVIDEIAFQTGILALNAAVEAARAGDSGMGFAVVADEVRNLAQRSADAAKDTARLIEESISKSNEGCSRLQQVSKAIHAITGKADQVKQLVEQVSTGSAEQARGVDQIAQAINQMEKVTQASAASAEETASAGEELNAQANTLRQVASELEQLVGAQANAQGRAFELQKA